ncbi:protein of unknown function [Nitrospira japonica]|uniref:Uncharacterized protein n=1 Tax=Nitrospira japonica TaxID=1325564 RepID=A0A1W1I1F2_9BACT|nr:protein of unknown function [Nitrospira japonica]
MTNLTPCIVALGGFLLCRLILPIARVFEDL